MFIIYVYRHRSAEMTSECVAQSEMPKVCTVKPDIYNTQISQMKWQLSCVDFLENISGLCWRYECLSLSRRVVFSFMQNRRMLMETFTCVITIPDSKNSFKAGFTLCDFHRDDPGGIPDHLGGILCNNMCSLFEIVWSNNRLTFKENSPVLVKSCLHFSSVTSVFVAVLWVSYGVSIYYSVRAAITDFNQKWILIKHFWAFHDYHWVPFVTLALNQVPVMTGELNSWPKNKYFYDLQVLSTTAKLGPYIVNPTFI